MSMIEVRTADLIGPALDWAVAKADGRDMALLIPVDGRIQICGMWSKDCSFAPSQGGPLIARHEISLHCPQSSDDVWAAWIVQSGGEFCCGGWTPLIAACRAIVAAKLGDVVNVPAELVIK